MQTARIEIEGQFNIDAAAFSGSAPLRLNRQPPTINTAGIRNWNLFCDAADRCLEAATRLKKQNSCAQRGFFLFIGTFVVFVNVLPRWEVIGYGPVKYAGLIVFPVVLSFIFFNCWVIRSFYASMDKLGEVCEAHTTSGVTYRLEKEHWGGCAKPHVKRYHIDVEVTDEEAPAPVATAVAVPVPVAQENHDAPDSFVSNYFSNQEATGATPSSNLADMLKS